MAELATPSAATMGTMNAGADGPPSAKAPFSSKPERPDEEAYKKELAEAEKALTSVQEKQVRSYWSLTTTILLDHAHSDFLFRIRY